MMKKTLLTLAATLAFSNTYALTAIESIALYQINLKQNAASIWPGLNIGKYPMIIPKDIFSGEGNSLYAFDLASSLWQQTSLQGVPVAYMEHDSIGAYTFAGDFSNFFNARYFSLQNQPAIVMPLFLDANDVSSGFDDEFNKSMMAITYQLMYELNDSPYSAAKRALFNTLTTQTVITDSFYNPEIFSELMLEISVLQDYLNTKNPALLKTFAAIQQYRTLNLDKNTALYETNLDDPFCFNYITMKAQTFNGIDGAQIILDQVLNQLPSLITQHDTSSIEPGEFYYNYFEMLTTINLIEQYVLDTLDPTWKTTVESQNTPSTTLLLQQFPLSSADINSLTQAAKAQYGYAGFYQDISNALTPYLAQMQQAVADYQNQAGIEFIMKRDGYSITGHTTYSGSEWRINSDASLISAVDWVYINDNSMNLNAYNMPAFMYSDFAADYLLRSKLGDTATITVDNNSPVTFAQFVQAGQSVKATQLTITGATWWFPVRITINMAGSPFTLSVVNGNVVFEYSAEAVATNSAKKFSARTQQMKSGKSNAKIKHMRNLHFPYVSL